MPKGRPRKPTKLHILEGTFREDRHGKNEPMPSGGMPICPRGMDAVAKAMWTKLIKAIGPTRVITKADETLMIHFCRLHSQCERASKELSETGDVLVDEKGKFYPNPYVKILHDGIKLMHSIGAELGVGAIGRSRIDVKPEQGETPRVKVRDRNAGPPPPSKGEIA